MRSQPSLHPEVSSMDPGDTCAVLVYVPTYKTYHTHPLPGRSIGHSKIDMPLDCNVASYIHYTDRCITQLVIILTVVLQS